MNDTPDILKRILERKAEEIEERRRSTGVDQLERMIPSAPEPIACRAASTPSCRLAATPEA
ncbi:MAG: hypothetical protein R3308_08730 [Thiohalobacterales bacterium]|nr:hypothetical protein [Thiohalobacterales bacterium]